MKKQLYVLISLIIPIHLFGQGLVNHTLIDFNNFEEQIQEVYPNPENQLLSVDGEAIASIGSELFMLDNWLVSLTNSSGENPISRRDSYSKRITSEEQGTVLGVRVKFPDWPYAGEASIKPKFPLLPFTADGNYANINNGVVTNVGGIKSVSMWANGRNFPFTVGLRAADINGKITEFGLGSLFYVGWRKLVYNNPFFSDRPVNNIRPNTRIYPSEIPLLRFEHIAVYKPHNQAGNDFVGYFGGINIEYTPYLTEMPTDIDDEANWGIIREEQERRAKSINSALYEEILQYEYAKQRVQDQNNNNDDNN
ncbi:MAG: flagellar filament outer layer protein FlaA [Brevinema sp.]